MKTRRTVRPVSALGYAAVAALAANLLGFGAVRADDARPSLESPDKILDRYVRRNDGAFAWKVRREGTSGTTAYAELILTSQRWRGMLWKHQLFVIRPANVSNDCH
ncbi:MAG TPA: hypothetical protein ENJ50_04005, partial [Planctomycetaceae bacterium]|nr:hypothetical protein [Planctomycetaceae bacterium]